MYYGLRWFERITIKINRTRLPAVIEERSGDFDA